MPSGIAHRDLRPKNSTVTREGQVKILDFELVKRGTPSRPALEVYEELAGSLPMFADASSELG